VVCAGWLWIVEVDPAICCSRRYESDCRSGGDKSTSRRSPIQKLLFV
jgi:hypothetical protein